MNDPHTSPLGSPMAFVSRAYVGGAPLWKAFWLFFVPTPLLLTGIYFGTLWSFPEIVSSVAYVSRFVLAFSLVSFLITSFPASAVWRCAPSTNRPLWGYLARITVAVYLVWLGWRTVVTWFVLSVQLT